MEAGKRNRLKVKRKPKNEGSPVFKAPHTHDKTDGTEVIVIDDESPRLATAAASTVETNSSVQDKGEETLQDNALNVLAEVLQAIDQHRKRVPMEMLPDLPPYQWPALVKGSNTTTVVSRVMDDLPPLPRLCPCKLQRKRKHRETSPEPFTGPVSPHSRAEQDENTPVDQHVLGAQEDQHAHSVEQNQHAHSVKQDQHAHSVEQNQHAHSAKQNQHAHSAEQNQHAHSVEQNQHAEQALTAHQRPSDSIKSSMSGPLSAVNAPVSKVKHPEMNESHAERSKRVSAGSKHETATCPSVSKQTVSMVSSSTLFSKFSMMPRIHDDVDEFEETTFPQRLTNSTKIGSSKPTRGQTSQKRQIGASPSSSGTIAKRRKMDCTSIGTEGASVAKSFFPTRTSAKPQLSSSKMSTTDKSQPPISSFSTKPPSQVSQKSEDFISSEPGSLRNASVSTSVNALSSKHKVTTLSDFRAAPIGSVSASKRLQSREDPNQVGASAMEQKHEAFATQGGSPNGPTAEESGRVTACPLCQVKLSTVMSQLDIDAHIAACLSASDEDIIW